MLQDTSAGAARLAHDRQADLRASARLTHRLRSLPRERAPRRALRVRPQGQPSFIVQHRPAKLRKTWLSDVAI